MRTKFGAFRQKCTIDPILGAMPPDKQNKNWLKNEGEEAVYVILNKFA